MPAEGGKLFKRRNERIRPKPHQPYMLAIRAIRVGSPANLRRESNRLHQQNGYKNERIFKAAKKGFHGTWCSFHYRRI
jgi:hypothetical protein